MEDVASLVESARSGDLDAFGLLVARFQDMAFGYAYAVLGDFHGAEDAAVEAFLAAHEKLGTLREPKAFAGWLRRIVATQCGRITRRGRIPTVPLDAAGEVASAAPDPAATAQKREMRERGQISG